MRRFRRIMSIALGLGVASFLIVPMLIPFSTSGTLTYRQAAGPSATFERIAGVDIHVVKSESTCDCQAPLILLLHGFGASTYSWQAVQQDMAKLGRVISYDRPGFGFTERPAKWRGTNPYSFDGNFKIIDGLIAKFSNGGPVVLVGHSAGGQLAAEYARLNASKISALVLVDPAILTTGGGPEGFDWVYQIPQVKKLGPVLVSGIAKSGDELLRQSYFDKSKLTPEVYESYHAPLKVIDWEVAFWNFAIASKKNDLANNLNTIIQPTLIVTGDSDTVVPTADAVKLKQLIPNAILEIIPSAGHLPQEEQPHDFLRVIESRWGELLN